MKDSRDYEREANLHRPEPEAVAREILRLHEEGLSSDDIARAMRLHRGVVEAVLMAKAA